MRRLRFFHQKGYEIGDLKFRFLFSYLDIFYQEAVENERGCLERFIGTRFTKVSRNRIFRYLEHIYFGLSYQDDYDFNDFWQKHEIEEEEEECNE